MNFLRRLLPLSILWIAVACADTSGPGGAPPEITALPRQLSTHEEAVIAASNTFGFNLLREVDRTFADSNVFLSPLSASMALGMTMNGAVGTTFTEMRAALGFGGQSYDELNAAYESLIALLLDLDPRVDFQIANAIFYRLAFGSAIEPAFLDDARAHFDAEVRGLDFGAPDAVTTVNDWAKTHTNGKIPRVIGEIRDEIVMLLMNAIYFKGDWRAGFAPSDTRNLPFTTSRGTEISTPTMYRKGGFRLRQAAGGATVVELPYGGDAFVMTILLPAQGAPINTVAAGLDAAGWSQLTRNLQDSELELFLPKFKLAWEDTLNDELKAMGMREAFIGDVADFSRMSRTHGPHLYISFVKQNSFVDVNEVGTEAAAVTTVGVGVTSLPPQVRIDRPFLFAIRERLSGTILFLGKIVEPKVG
jgi:serpin B